MRELINSTYVSLDGVIGSPHLWPPLKPGPPGGVDAIQTEVLKTCDIALMGRRTYDVFAPAWMARGGDPAADLLNTMRKVVVSTTLTDPQWQNTEVIADDVVERVRALKKEDGGHIVQYGFGDVSRLLLENGLFDRIILWFHPQFVGPDDADDLLYRPGVVAAFELVESRALPNGIIMATYRP